MNNTFDDDSDYCMHYGVLGMKWGVRKARKSGKTYQAESTWTKDYKKQASKYQEKANEAKYVGDTKRAKKNQVKANRSKELAKIHSDLDKKTQKVALKEFKGPKGAAKYAGLNALSGLYGPIAYSEAIAANPKMSKGKAVLHSWLNSYGGLQMAISSATKTNTRINYQNKEYAKAYNKKRK